MPALLSVTQNQNTARPLADGLLEPLFDLSALSESLSGSRHPVVLQRQRLEIPKFMLLGARPGGGWCRGEYRQPLRHYRAMISHAQNI